MQYAIYLHLAGGGAARRRPGHRHLGEALEAQGLYAIYYTIYIYTHYILYTTY